MHKELLKPQYDLRYDNCVKQLFTVMNTTISSSSHKKNRLIKIRTYNAFPLSDALGLIECVKEAAPFKYYILFGHIVYRAVSSDLKPYRQQISQPPGQGVRSIPNDYEGIFTRDEKSFRRMVPHTGEVLLAHLHFSPV